MDGLLFSPCIPLPSPSPPPLTYSEAAAVAATAIAAAPASTHESAAGESDMGGMASGASEATDTSTPALAGHTFDIARIDLSPSVDIHLSQQSESTKDAIDEVRSDGSASEELEAVLGLPSLTPEPCIGSVLDAVEHQTQNEHTVGGKLSELRHQPLRLPSVDEQHSHCSTIELNPHHFCSQVWLPPVPQSAEQQPQAALIAPLARPSAYTYSEPIQRSHRQPSQPSTARRTSCPAQQKYGAQNFGYQPPPQHQPAVCAAGQHPSMAYYHRTDETLPAHSQPTASHTNSVHSFIHRYQQLEVQRDEVVRSYRQVEATLRTRPPQEHALLMQHLEHRYQQLQMEIDTTEWMLRGTAQLSTTAEVPSIHNLTQEAQPIHQQHQQRIEEEKEEEEEGEEYSEREAAENETMLAQSYEDSNSVQRKKRKQFSEESDRVQTNGDQQVQSETTVKARTKKSHSNKRRRNPDAAPHPISAYIFFHMDRMQQWQRAHPKAHTNAAEQGKMSGAEWRTLTGAQKQPYIDRAQHDKEIKQPHITRRPNTTSRHIRTDEKQNTTAGCVSSTGVVEQSGEEKDASEQIVTRDERKEALEKVAEVEEEFSELSPALSSRRPSDPFVQALGTAAEANSGHSTLLHSASTESPRPASAMQLYISDSVGRLMEEAREKRVKILKGDAKKTARTQWDQLTPAEKDVHWRQLHERALKDWKHNSHLATLPQQNPAVTAQLATDHSCSSAVRSECEEKESGQIKKL